MDIQRFKQYAEQLKDALQREADIKSEIADICTIMKANADLTHPEVATTKRILKAEIKGTLEDLRVKMADDQIIFDTLTGIKEKISEKKSAIPHDPDTGEIIESAPERNADVAPDAIGQTSQGVQTPQEEAKVRDSLSANDIIGDDPIPAFLDRR